MYNMKRLALIITIVGLFALFGYLKFSQPLVITNLNQTYSLVDNQKVLLSGSMTSQRSYDENVIILIDNNLSLNCDRPCPIKYVQNKTPQVRGFILCLVFLQFQVLD